MSTVVTNRGRIGVVEQGSGKRTPIIFLHGVGSDKSVWQPQLEHFGSARRAVAFDYPGYGESAFVEGATRDGYGWRVSGELESGSAYWCTIDNNGQVSGVGGSGWGYAEPVEDGQYDDDYYARARDDGGYYDPNAGGGF